MIKRLLPFVFFACSIFIASACIPDRRIKTHPDPDVRIKKMQQSLDELRNEEKISDQVKDEKEEDNDQADQTDNSSQRGN